MVRSFNEIPGRMSKLGEDVTSGATRLVQSAAIGIGATVVDTTRVDTGRARSNWRMTLSAPASGVRNPYSPGNKLGIGEKANATAAKSQHKQTAERFDVRKHVHVYITNNTPYIGALNNGSPTNSADQMVRRGLQTGRVIIKGFKIFGKR